MIGGGCALILQENLATEPSVTTTDIGWSAKEDIPAQNIMRNKLKTFKDCSTRAKKKKKSRRSLLATLFLYHVVF